jgi:Restriction alleviation protein Lar
MARIQFNEELDINLDDLTNIDGMDVVGFIEGFSGKMNPAQAVEAIEQIAGNCCNAEQILEVMEMLLEESSPMETADLVAAALKQLESVPDSLRVAFKDMDEQVLCEHFIQRYSLFREDTKAQMMKPCPHCGMQATVEININNEDDIARCYQVICNAQVTFEGQMGCGSSSGFKNTIAKAVTLWNRRS